MFEKTSHDVSHYAFTFFDAGSVGQNNRIVPVPTHLPNNYLRLRLSNQSYA